MRKLLIGFFGIMVALALTGCAAGAGKTVIRAGGSTTVQPLMERWAEEYEKAHPNVDIKVQGGGSSAGVKGAIEGEFDIGAMSRELKESERAKCPELKVQVVAMDGIAIVVNERTWNELGEKVHNLSLNEVRNIFAGRITNWREVRGPDRDLVVCSREEGSGTRTAFEKIVMKGSEITPKAELFPSNGAVRAKILTTDWAIGFLSLGYVEMPGQEPVKAFSINRIPARSAHFISGEYPIVRNLNLVTKGEPKGEVAKLINFILSEEGQKISEDEGYLPVR